MKFVMLLSALCISTLTFAQHQKGFQDNEAIELIQICNSFSALDLYGTDKDFIPKNYIKIHTSKSVGMDNAFQVYADENNKKAIIHFRGSTQNKISWMENFYATLIPANDQMTIDGKKFKYNLSNANDAFVHAGYTLAIFYLENPIINQIKSLNKKGIYTIYLTGHSQGGALAQIFTAYLDLLPNKDLKDNHFKTYAFANPMIGNHQFVKDYNTRFCETGRSYLIHNPKDMVVKLPLAYNDTTFLKAMLDDYSTNPDFSAQATLMQGMMYMMKDKISQMANTMFANVEKQIFNELGTIVLPENKQTKVQYSHTGNKVLIEPADYEGIEIPKSDMKMPQEMEKNPIASTMKKMFEETGLQHKSYNYYTGLLKKYRSTQYQNLQEKVFIPK